MQYSKIYKFFFYIFVIFNLLFFAFIYTLINFKNNKFDFPGTAIKMKLQIPKNNLNTKELINSIVEEGEKIAEQENDTIKVASKRSKSLKL